MQSVMDDAKTRMKKALSALDKEFSKLRTGRASTSLVDDILVDYYGTPTPLKQIASVAIPDSRSITIQPWDRGAFGPIEKAIITSDLGLNPVNDGKLMRIAIPPLTEDRRKELVKVAKKYTEDCKVAIRNVRRDSNDTLKKMEKDKDISEDDQRRGQDEVQKITNQMVEQSDKQFKAKEAEIMEI
ncbi:ribosome recycling factor [Desulfobaculum bizertense]|uniref:Ribosome-recycling factor n=1 Tax=Desulfobaculum bizertense DSM 18034 TaxID=1121442 RepID=A0A1T4VW39_9BACT|nr:ribosome recycling factor [Desulfobaculum bizertense]UIJ36754.1 ribosome recycling factor [Desulfobaculum bizertense]SKA69177.1 ribosome recycling factor [Desulfobaculum bizertense DSM 18034]